ncbi:MAG TPA: helicase-related protein, partial [Clostridia bacterium]|nr:helicase-related protein [Clostridia bacterium]
QDMERSMPMDRLLCGDVGYGKTEVALRAAFKAVMDGKQVAFLAPTTILTQQHFHTIQERFKGFPMRAEFISRFKTATEQREILHRLRNGEIDILVGTHRMLAKDVRFKALGLLVVDEEQRFGVQHKESIKNLKNTIDVLTLSATPIPRTLHMSMVGIRDMSLLETPPEERYPVQTYVLEYSDGLVRDAILRELARGGQIYLLYNRVETIERFYEQLRELVPEARIAIGHGQMREHMLEDVMLDFYEGRFDVLLCTTIIESGLDVPRANTLIVYDADYFGLAQLYQLRGRVGRSNRLAYAYLTIRPDKVLSETADKRLQAIREFTEFGSGFRIAMRDLEIRGAGNLLGAEQHGFLSTVGYDMYCKLLEETVRELRGEMGEAEAIETRVEFHVDAYLPVEYVHDDQQRMEIYKRIAACETRAQREDLEEEMVDRFGDLPEQVLALMDIALLKALVNHLGVDLISYTMGQVRMRFAAAAKPDLAHLVPALQEADKRLLLSAGTSPSLILRDARLPALPMLRETLSVMERV